jgi:hypothetical protein
VDWTTFSLPLTLNAPPLSIVVARWIYLLIIFYLVTHGSPLTGSATVAFVTVTCMPEEFYII